MKMFQAMWKIAPQCSLAIGCVVDKIFNQCVR